MASGAASASENLAAASAADLSFGQGPSGDVPPPRRGGSLPQSMTNSRTHRERRSSLAAAYPWQHGRPTAPLDVQAAVDGARRALRHLGLVEQDVLTQAMREELTNRQLTYFLHCFSSMWDDSFSESTSCTSLDVPDFPGCQVRSERIRHVSSRRGGQQDVGPASGPSPEPRPTPAPAPSRRVSWAQQTEEEQMPVGPSSSSVGPCPPTLPDRQPQPYSAAPSPNPFAADPFVVQHGAVPAQSSAAGSSTPRGSRTPAPVSPPFVVDVSTGESEPEPVPVPESTSAAPPQATITGGPIEQFERFGSVFRWPADPCDNSWRGHAGVRRLRFPMEAFVPAGLPPLHTWPYYTCAERLRRKPHLAGSLACQFFCTTCRTRICNRDQQPFRNRPHRHHDCPECWQAKHQLSSRGKGRGRR